MGAVYRATHVKLGRKAAIKVLARELISDEQFVSRFFHEARIVNEVRHPNIVDIYDFIEQDEPKIIAYVMELVEGPSIGDVLKNQGLTPLQAVHATMQIAGALDAVHKVGVIHRDLKPDNVLIAAPLDSDFSAPSSVKILDFGIAKVADPNRSHKTGTGFLLGTPPYMAPEQIGGESVTPAADVYAVGEILFEMLTGKRLFNGDMHVILRKKVTGELPDLMLPADLPKRDDIQALIAQCLATAPEARPTMKAIIGWLDQSRARLTGEKPITAPGRTHSGAATTATRSPPTQERVDTAPRLLEGSISPAPAPAGNKSLAVTLVGGAIGIALGVAIFLAMTRDDVVVEEIKPAAPIEQPAQKAEPAPPAAPPEPAAPPAPARVETEAAPVKSKPAAAKKKAKKSEATKKSSGPIKKEELPSW